MASAERWSRSARDFSNLASCGKGVEPVREKEKKEEKPKWRGVYRSCAQEDLGEAELKLVAVDAESFQQRMRLLLQILLRAVDGLSREQLVAL